MDNLLRTKAAASFAWLAAALSAVSPARAADMVPFVIPTTQNEKSLLAFHPAPIEPNAPRVVARDGHFYVGDSNQRVRVWGVNLCFGANFPTHADAERVATRLAAFGVNSVRHHHMDNQAFPRGIWDPKDPMKLSAEALDRLDYLLAQLAAHGIYSNINLHVSRTHSKYLKLPDPASHDFDKMVDIFTPALVDAQKKYARDLLTHVNPYRKLPGAAAGLRLADDPAVAFVEISNEDSLFMWDAEDKLRNLPEFYAKILAGLYNRWLAKRYGDTAALEKAWSAGALPLGENLLVKVTDLDVKDAPGKWTLEQHAPAKASAAASPNDANATRIDVSAVSDTYWHIQFRQFGLAVRAGQYYTVSFRARAQEPRDITVGLTQHQDPWGQLGLGQGLKVGAEWKAYRVGFVAKDDEKNARLTFSLGQVASWVELADVELRPGGKEGLGRVERLPVRAATTTKEKARGQDALGTQGRDALATGTVALFGGSETEARTIDRLRFFAETEKNYFDSMREYVKKELGCKSAVTGTIVFGPLGLWAQSDMDYVDAHAYWHHPYFPHKAWDMNDWTVEQTAMVDHPEKSTLYELAAQRLAGKPFTVSEYNHPAPNDYQAECVPMIASFAAAQDWDGVWLFAYSHGGTWDREAFEGFFDIDANPAKWGFMPAGAAMMKRPADMMVHYYVPLAAEPNTVETLARFQISHGGDMRSIATEIVRSRLWTGTRVSMCLADANHVPAGGGDRLLLWYNADANLGSHVYIATGSGFRVAAGRMKDGTPTAELNIHGVFRSTSPDFVTFAVTPLDGLELEKSKKVLLVACGRCENTGMQFSPDRRTVGRNWGKAPVTIEAVDAVVEIHFAWKEEWTCQAIRPDGMAGKQVPVGNLGAEGGFPFVTLSAKYGTMWYLLRRQ